jgi:hypothetical protein
VSLFGFGWSDVHAEEKSSGWFQVRVDEKIGFGWAQIKETSRCERHQPHFYLFGAPRPCACCGRMD